MAVMEKTISVPMSLDMVRQIDHARAEQTQETGRAVSRSDIVRDALRQSLAASYTTAPLTPVTLTKDA